MAVLALLGIVLYGFVVAPEEADDRARIVAALLYLGLIGGATAGHVLGLAAFFGASLREERERGRPLAFAGVVLGVLLLLVCTLLGVVGANAFRVLAALLG